MHVDIEATQSASPFSSECCQSVSAEVRSPRGPGHAAQHVDSPALVPWKPGDAPAYELKFLLEEQSASQVEALLAGCLVHDPHSRPELGNAYRITTVYCDTPDFDVLHGVGNYRRRKYRIRSYGTESRVHLERKTKKGGQVRKKRSVVESEELTSLSEFQSRESWNGDWFHRQLLSRRLNPVCCLRYLRTAYVGTSAEGPMRLTFDRNLAGAVSQSWLPKAEVATVPFLEHRVVCEFKFRGSLPALFKSAIEALQLAPCGVSKYRHCMQATVVITDRAANHA